MATNHNGGIRVCKGNIGLNYCVDQNSPESHIRAPLFFTLHQISAENGRYTSSQPAVTLCYPRSAIFPDVFLIWFASISHKFSRLFVLVAAWGGFDSHY